ncbi:MAG: cytochrome c maturation protein CcmE [Acidimicrobiia bacterium]
MKYRVFVIPAAGVALVIAGFLFFNLSDDLIYYQTPSEAIERRPDFPDGKRFRLGGFVEPGSVGSEGLDGVQFLVSDGTEAVRVVHRGAARQLFREGIGVVVEGSWAGDEFMSDTMIIKHDEQYRTRDGGVYTPDQRGLTP